MKIEELFEKNQKLVPYIFHKYNFAKYFSEKDDLIQSGYIGLWEACKSFDESKGFKFATYAVPIVRGKMSNYLRSIKRHFSTVSFDTPIFLKDREIGTFEDMLEDVSCQNEFLLIESGMLDVLDKSPFVKRHIEGYSQTEIGKEKGISQAQVSRDIARQIKQLKVILRDVS